MASFSETLYNFAAFANVNDAESSKTEACARFPENAVKTAVIARMNFIIAVLPTNLLLLLTLSQNYGEIMAKASFFQKSAKKGGSPLFRL